MLMYYEKINKGEKYYWFSYSIHLEGKNEGIDNYIYTKDGDEFREIIDKSKTLRKGIYCGKLFPFINF